MAATFPEVNDAIRQAIGDTPRRGRMKEIALALGTPAPNVSRWYTGDNTPDRDQWPRIEEVLGLAPGDLARAAAGLPHDSAVDAEIAALPELLADLTRRVEALEAAASQSVHPASRPPKVVPITTATTDRPRAAKKKTPPRLD